MAVVIIKTHESIMVDHVDGDGFRVYTDDGNSDMILACSTCLLHPDNDWGDETLLWWPCPWARPVILGVDSSGMFDEAWRGTDR